MKSAIPLLVSVSILLAGCGDRSDQAQKPAGPVAATDAAPGSPAGTSPSNAAGVDRGQQQPGGGTSTNAAASGHGALSTFEDLDTAHRGYLTPADLSADSLVAHRFGACDTDGDGRLTRAEFMKCKSAP